MQNRARLQPLIAALCAVLVLGWAAQLGGEVLTSSARLSPFGPLPVSFIENAGQESEGVRFVVQDAPATLTFTAGEVRFELHAAAQSSGVSIRLEGADPDAQVEGVGPVASRVNYYRGDDPSNWFEGVPAYSGIRYEQPWPGIDVLFDGASGGIESIYTIAAGADPGAIQIVYHGQQALRLGAGGELIVETDAGRIVESAPILFQQIGGQRVPVEGAFELDGNRVSFNVAGYDAAYPLVIDPSITYSTYLGGSGSDQANAVAIDALGNVFIAGFTTSTNFPTLTPAQAANGGSRDVFVTKLNATGTALLYSTYIGGADFDAGAGVAIDASGNAYVTGSTFSTNFPTLTPFQPANGGGGDAFAVKLTSEGALSYSTYLGGSDDDEGHGIAQSAGSAYVVGKTLSADFPTLVPFQAVLTGLNDAFVTRFATTGSTLVYSTYLGGATTEDGRAIAVDGSGNAYVAGSTASINFPIAAAFQAAQGGVEDAFVTKLNSAGSAGGLVYSTYLGGSGIDGGYGIALDTTSNAYVTGIAASTNFPTASPYQAANAGSDDAFVTKLNSAGSASGLLYSTYIGGSSGDAGAAISVDSSGRAHVTGSTFSTNFPLVGAFQTTHTGATADAFTLRFGASGAAPDYSSYLGGGGSDRGWGIAADNTGHAFVAGSTQSSDFPTVGAYQGAYAGLGDAFAAKIDGAITDIDGDGIADAADNCPTVPNPLQENADRNFIDQTPPSSQDDRTVVKSDAMGDACDSDADNDGLSVAAEAAGCNGSGPLSDTDGDFDNDRVLDNAECILLTNPASAASKPSAAACGPTTDTDGDRITNRAEFCGYNSNMNAVDTDGDQDGFPLNPNPLLNLTRDGCEAASVNSDRVVNSGDQLLMVLEILRETTPSLRLVSMDVNKDGAVNVGDQLILAQFISPAGQCP
jgi:hypothetical protein